MSKKTKYICRAGIIGGLYALLTVICFPVSSGAIQVRISEGLTLLPIMFPESIVGLTVGCVVANIVTGCTVIDVIFGSAITLFSAILTRLITKKTIGIKKKIFFGGLFPVICNALLLPVIWEFVYGAEYTYIVQCLILLLGQSVSVYLIGTPIIITIYRWTFSE